MRISEAWLREWIKTPLDVRILAARLTAAGVEVSRIEPAAAALDQVIVGRIAAVVKHPDAANLQVCSVDIGAKTPLQIVCGAANAAINVRAPVALIGARLPDGRTIAKTGIRGVESHGMLCSGAEIGLEESSNGLYLLGDGAKPGKGLVDYLQLSDNIIEVELTPNRGDCLSVRGLARELAAVMPGRLLPKKNVRRKVAAKSPALKVKVTAKQDCPRYIGQAITGINREARTPEWMRERLRRSGMRSIHPVVDVTNYVMLELGQPMHAFDLARIRGIDVRHAVKGEKLLLLDDREVELIPGTLIIADGSAPLAIAGTMGGRASAVDANTTGIFFESAYFRAETVARYARQYGLHTESSHRFERGVDPMLQAEALAYAVDLLTQIAGGQPGPIQQADALKFLPRPTPIHLRAQRIDTVLGTKLRDSDVTKILARLAMKVKKSAGRSWSVTPPSYRSDIGREEDLIEELVRIHGYEKLPQRLPRLPMQTRVAGRGVAVERARDILVARGYQEVITYSFVDETLQSLLVPNIAAPKLLKPLSSEMAAMRTSLLPGMIGALRHNLNRQQSRVQIFEIGTCFAGAGPYTESRRIAGIWSGDVLPEQWGEDVRSADFYDLKNDVEALAGLGGYMLTAEPLRDSPVLHPGRAAVIALGSGPVVGRMGQLHPNLTAKLDLPACFLFEIELHPLLTPKATIFHELSKFPSIRRDLSVIVPEDVPARTVLLAASKAAGTLLSHINIFDRFQGEGIDSGRKSLGLTLTLQDSSRTLNDEAVEHVMAKVIAALQEQFGAQLRQ